MSSNVSKKRRTQDLDHFIRSGIAGGVAGCVAKTVVAPLDRVKILFQTSNPDFKKYAGTWSGAFRAGAQIYKEAGARGLLQGHSATLLRVFPYAAVKFIAYDHVHTMLMPTPAHETNFRRFAAGAISGTISVFFTYPLELIRVRMAFQTRSASPAVTPKFPLPVPVPLRPSFLHAAHNIYNEAQSHLALLQASSGMVPYAGTAFLAWGYLRAHLLPDLDASGRRVPAPLSDLGIGALAGAMAQTVSYPFEIVRRRMQVGGLTEPDRWLHWGETVRAVWTRSGWRGFYVGLSIGYLKVIPMNAVSFAVWQWMKRFLEV